MKVGSEAVCDFCGTGVRALRSWRVVDEADPAGWRQAHACRRCDEKRAAAQTTGNDPTTKEGKS